MYVLYVCVFITYVWFHRCSVAKQTKNKTWYEDWTEKFVKKEPKKNCKHVRKLENCCSRPRKLVCPPGSNLFKKICCDSTLLRNTLYNDNVTILLFGLLCIHYHATVADGCTELLVSFIVGA